MLQAPSELLNRIRLGEDSFLEFKEAHFSGDKVIGPHRSGFADELAAFANSRGGVCVLGVHDSSREIRGIPLDRMDLLEKFIQEVASDSVEPPLSILTERLFLPTGKGSDVPVLKIEIPRSLFVHRSPGGYFHRIGSSKREMSPEFLARLFQQRSQARIIRFDEQTLPRATLEDLSPALWERFKTPRSGKDSREAFLEKLGLARQDEDSVWRPTVAGILLSSEEPRRFLPNAFIQAVAYRGTSIAPAGAEGHYQLDAADISGPLDRQAIDALKFVNRNMKIAASKEIGRRDRPQFDLTAVFEALVNAVAHRDYAIHGAKIRLRLFDDRLELFSPGALPNTMTVESLPLRQSARNEVITSLLARCPVPREITGLETDRVAMMDKRGEGVSIILDRGEGLSGRPPEYRIIDEAELMLTLWAAPAL